MYEQAVPLPHFCNLFQVIYKESPLCSLVLAFAHESAESLMACLINLLPENFGALSVSVQSLLQHFWGCCLGFGGWCFHLLVTSLVSPAHQEGSPCQVPPDLLIQGRDPPPGESRRQALVTQRNLKKLGKQPDSPTHQTVKNLDSNSDLP
jgi:hypothetical protein